MFILSVGDFVNGIDFYGPFHSSESATEYAHEKFRGETWLVIKLIKPKITIQQI